MTANQINFAKLQEDIRHNVASENEMQRHNVESENISAVANDINRSNVEYTHEHNVRQDAINEEHYARMDAETARSHLAQETETNRSNLAKEFETNRSNVADWSERVRHDVATEEETARNNREMEAVARKNAKSNRISAEASQTSAEAASKNAAVNEINATTRKKELDLASMKYELEKYQVQRNVAYNQGVLLVRQAELDEANRHNKEQELIGWQNAQMPFLLNAGADVKARESGARADLSKAEAQQALMSAGYLQKQSDWYVWNTMVQSGTKMSEAIVNFVKAVNPLKR